MAIADVAWYVRPGDALDRDAFQRGNSVYLPDTVLPMLPEPLSNGWCSLRPNEDRACLAAHLWIDSGGKLRRQRFERAMMRSAARLTYSQAQSAYDGKPDELTAPLLDNVITPLYGAYNTMVRERDERSPLDLDIPERHIEFDQSGKVLNIAPQARLESHRLIEEFMIKANVAAALTLEKARTPCLYRIHDEPPADKLDSFREFVSSMGVKFPKGQVLAPGIFNRFLDQADQQDLGELASQVVLRSQSQAEYSERNHGHFGLGLAKYCHFTSPIRRYADLYIHRALISGLKLGDGGLDPSPIDLEDISKRINATERLAVKAERDTVDRFTVAYLADHVGDRVMGRISGRAGPRRSGSRW